jgi:hypothetical protein
MDASQARWAALGIAARLLSSHVKFGLVFHTEGLINDKVVGKLKEFALELRGEFRPTLAVITPLCPQYYIDPLIDPLRREFSKPKGSGEDAKFEKTIRELSDYYDIGYHGHFFVSESGRYKPAFDKNTITDQFAKEHAFLKGIGFTPWTYAGGWWHISKHIVSLLEKFAFKLDTTVNDVLLDSFDRRQPYSPGSLGTPFWLGDQILEVQSVRSFHRILNRNVLRTSKDKFYILSLHDYDLMNPGLKSATKAILRLAARNAMLSADELYSKAGGATGAGSRISPEEDTID